MGHAFDPVVVVSFCLAATIGPDASREKAAEANCLIAADRDGLWGEGPFSIPVVAIAVAGGQSENGAAEPDLATNELGVAGAINAEMESLSQKVGVMFSAK